MSQLYKELLKFNKKTIKKNCNRITDIHFLRKDMLMAMRHRKIYSTSVAIRDIKIKPQ